MTQEHENRGWWRTGTEGERWVKQQKEIKLVVKAIRQGDNQQAQQRLGAIHWRSDLDKQKGVAAVWSLALEGPISEQVRNLLEKEVPFVQALAWLEPSWGDKKWKFGKLLEFNPDLVREASDSEEMGYAWMALLAALRRGDRAKGEPWKALWNTKSVQGNIQGRMSDVLVNALEGKSIRAVTWALQVLTPPRRAGQQLTKGEFLEYGLRCSDNTELGGQWIGELLDSLIPTVIEGVNWPALLDQANEDVMTLAKAELGRRQLDRAVGKAETGKSSKQHL